MNIVKKMVTKRAKWAVDKYPHIEIKAQHDGAQAVICVSVDGAEYSQYDNRLGGKWTASNRGTQVRISMNAGMNMTISEWRALNNLIEESYIEVKNEHQIRGL